MSHPAAHDGCFASKTACVFYSAVLLRERHMCKCSVFILSVTKLHNTQLHLVAMLHVMCHLWRAASAAWRTSSRDVTSISKRSAISLRVGLTPPHTLISGLLMRPYRSVECVE